MSNLKLPVQLRGIVTKFKGNGRKLGYPTANIKSPTSLKDGVYFGFATLDIYHFHPALIFIGTPTTVGDADRRVEAHLLDILDKDYYDLPLELSVHYFHRPNHTFNSIDQLLVAMKSDEVTARNWFKQFVASEDLGDT